MSKNKDRRGIPIPNFVFKPLVIFHTKTGNKEMNIKSVNWQKYMFGKAKPFEKAKRPRSVEARDNVAIC